MFCHCHCGGSRSSLRYCLMLLFFCAISSVVVVVEPKCPDDNAPILNTLQKDTFPPCSTVEACKAAVLVADKPRGRIPAMKACVPLWSPCVLVTNGHESAAEGGCAKTIKSQDAIDLITDATKKATNQQMFKAYNDACKATGAQSEMALRPTTSKDDTLFVNMEFSVLEATKCPCRKKTGTGGKALAALTSGGEYLADGHFVICNRARTVKPDGVWNALSIDVWKKFAACEGSGIPCVRNELKNVVPAGPEKECCGPGSGKSPLKDGEDPFHWPPEQVFDACCDTDNTERLNLFPAINSVRYNKKVLSGIQFVCACGKVVTKAVVAGAHSQPQSNWLLGASQERVERMETMGRELADAGFERGWEAGLKLNRMKHDHAQNHRQRRRRNRHNGHV